MPRAANPLLPRLEYIARTYPAFVTVITFSAWAEATGDHYARRQVLRMFGDLRLKSGLSPKEALDRTLYHVRHTGLGLPEQTRYDRYLPWVASQVNRAYRLYAKAARKLGIDAPVPVWINLVSGRLESTPHSAPLVGPLRRLSATSGTLIASLHAIVDWAQAEHIDLGPFTWQEALERTQEWSRLRSLEGIEPGAVVYAWDDGWTVQELTTAEQFAAEGDVMQHCVGSYSPSAAGEEFRLFSLRDPRGRPHVTMEFDLDDGTIPEFKGKQNDLPRCDYVARMVAFRRDVLARYAKSRPMSGMDVGWLDAFPETLLGVWAYNPLGTLEHLHGKFGALEEAMKRDELVAVYEWEGHAHPRRIEGLAEQIQTLQDAIHDFPPPDLEYDPEDPDSVQALVEWENDQMREGLSHHSLRGADLRGGLGIRLYDDSAPGMAWAVWNATGYTESHDPNDEMMVAIRECELAPNDVQIIAGHEPVEAIKRRLAP